MVRADHEPQDGLAKVVRKWSATDVLNFSPMQTSPFENASPHHISDPSNGQSTLIRSGPRVRQRTSVAPRSNNPTSVCVVNVMSNDGNPAPRSMSWASLRPTFLRVSQREFMAC